MLAKADHLSFVEHDNLVGVLDGADALGDDEHSGVLCLLGQSLAQRRIGFKVQSGEAVVEDVKLRLFDQSAGNGKTLLLAAGKVGAALCHKGI